MTYGVVIVAWNGAHWLPACLTSVFQQPTPPSRVVAIDNASRDDTAGILRGFGPVAQSVGAALTILEQPRNLGFVSGANLGLRCLLSSHVDAAVLVNQDATLDPGWWAEVSAVLDADPRVGAVGSKILYPNRLTVQHAGGYLEHPRLVGRHVGHHDSTNSLSFDEQREVEYITAAAMALRVTALRETGLFDEMFSPGYYEDVDLCHRLHARTWKVLYCPSAVGTHAESTSLDRRAERLGYSHRSRLIFALPSLVHADVRETFCRAERAHIAGNQVADERSGLAFAYLSLLLRLPELLQARVPGAITPETYRALVEMFSDLRAQVLQTSAMD